MLARTPSYCFCRKVLWFCFSRSLKAIKRPWARFALPFAVVNIIKMIFVMKLRLHEGRCSPMIILLCNLLRWNLSKCSQFVKFVLPIIKKLEKRDVTKAVSLLFAILCYLSLSQIWSYEFFYQHTLGRAQMCLMVQQILGNSICGNVINLAQEIPILLVAKHHEMEKNFAKIYIWACVNFRIGRLLAICPTVFFFGFSGVLNRYVRTQISRGQKTLWSLLKRQN